MWPESSDDKRSNRQQDNSQQSNSQQGNSAGDTITPALRTGLTTGSCATACCIAAAIHYFTQQSPSTVSITLPSRRSSADSDAALCQPEGKTVEMTIEQYQRIDVNEACVKEAGVKNTVVKEAGVKSSGDNNPSTTSSTTVRTSTIKDAGDDPDATHGATVFVELQFTAVPGVIFAAAEGVGTVTRDGLLLAVGEPAINPVPRQMMREHLQALAEQYDYDGGFIVAVGVENGESIAQKTMNPRLGIIGGLSILGTTGIVRPFSCAAWIASIYQGIDVALANGLESIAASTGNRSEETIRHRDGLDDMALIEMGDFAGAVLKHVRKLARQASRQTSTTALTTTPTKTSTRTSTKTFGLKNLIICGGFGKISKLAQGHMDLNSRASSIDLEFIASVAKTCGADTALCEKIQHANTSIAALQYCQAAQIPLAEALCQRALQVAQHIVPSEIHIEIIAIDRKGTIVATAQASGDGSE